MNDPRINDVRRLGRQCYRQAYAIFNDAGDALCEHHEDMYYSALEDFQSRLSILLVALGQAVQMEEERRRRSEEHNPAP